MIVTEYFTVKVNQAQHTLQITNNTDDCRAFTFKIEEAPRSPRIYVWDIVCAAKVDALAVGGGPSDTGNSADLNYPLKRPPKILFSRRLWENGK